MIKVYNVGQGDSFMFQANEGDHTDLNLLIDCGFAKATVYKKITEDFNHILITHSDGDHIGGLEDLITHKNILHLHIPYYLPEIIKINEYFKKKLKKSVVKLTPAMLNGLKVHLRKDGDKSSCGNIQIFNPPSDSSKIFYTIKDDNTVSNDLLLQAIEKLNELGLNIKSDHVLNYESDILEFLDEDIKNTYRTESQLFIYRFFVSLYFAILEEDLNQNTIKRFLKRFLKMTANQISIVLKYKDNNTSYLFTGDADISTFERIFDLHNESILKADILKIPHHGSRYNINNRILKLINPRVAIVSHDNRHRHPHKSLRGMLDTLRIKTYYTNDVKSTTIAKTVGSVELGDIDFI